MSRDDAPAQFDTPELRTYHQAMHEKQLKIKTESLPERCEVCHQADWFIPGKNYCVRCAGNIPAQVPPKATSRPDPNVPARGFKSLDAPFIGPGKYLGILLGGLVLTSSQVIPIAIFCANKPLWQQILAIIFVIVSCLSTLILWINRCFSGKWTLDPR